MQIWWPINCKTSLLLEHI